MQQGLIMPARQHAAYPAQATSLPIRARFMDMLHANALLADALANNLMEVFACSFGASAPGHAALIGEAARLIIERLSFAALTHDIGYVRGVCPGDDAASCVVNREGATVDLPRGASDAFLAPYHVERSKIAVRARFANHDLVDAERIASAIELTRFPVPEDGDHAEIDSEVAFVRAVIAPLHSVSDQKAVETDTESRLRSAAPEAVRIGGCRHTSRILRENSLSRGTAKSRKARILIGRNRLAV